MPKNKNKKKTKKRLVAVVAHSRKTLGQGLGELRRVLAAAGQPSPLWREVSTSREAPKAVRRAIKKGARLIFVWGGDGMVQRCVDAVGGTKGVELAIVPAGTANLLASNLGVPADIAQAVEIGLRGTRRKLDVGKVNGERFAVMAGVGFDARMIGGVSPAEKRRTGRLAYFRSGLQAMRAPRVRATVTVDGAVWFEGKASAVLVANVGTVSGGLEVFPSASPSDGLLEVGVVTAHGTLEWLSVFSRVAAKSLEQSPHVQRTRGKKIVVELGRKSPYELDGGSRPEVKRLEFRIKPAAISLCVPRARAKVSPPLSRSRARARPRRDTAGTRTAPLAAAEPAPPH
jgi:diacylglycerol kinase (ATP)